MIATACSSSELSWRAQPPAPALAGKLVITVADRRVGAQGGDDPRVIGSEHGAFFIPNELKLSEPTDAADTIRRLFVGAALTAGIGVAQTGDTSGSATLAVEIHNLWCDGVALAYTKARLVATLTALGPDGSTRVADLPPLQIEGGGANCRGAYEKMLTDAYSAAASILMTPPIKGALTGH
jgi:hypothetical protein